MVVQVLGLCVAGGCQRPEIDIASHDDWVVVIEDKPGYGRLAEVGDLVRINYRVTKSDGTVVMQGGRYEFQLGAGAVVPCVDEIVPGMKIGGRRVAECRPNTHWGDRGYGPVPKDSMLTFAVELLNVD